jgi:hypothetical protein
MKKFYINSSDKTDHLNQRYFFNFNGEILKNGIDVKILFLNTLVFLLNLLF